MIKKSKSQWQFLIFLVIFFKWVHNYFSCYGWIMIICWLKISAAFFLTLILSVSLTKLIVCIWDNFYFTDGDERFDVEAWLEQNRLQQHKEEFRKRGKSFFCFRIHSIPIRIKGMNLKWTPSANSESKLLTVKTKKLPRKPHIQMVN